MATAAETLILNHVQQRANCDCVVATAATVANVDYPYAADRSPVVPGSRVMYPVEIGELLQRTTGIRWRGPCRLWWRSWKSFVDAPSSCVLAIRKKWSIPWKNCHCVTAGLGLVYDPEFPAAAPLIEYARRNWSILYYFRPHDFSELRQVQEHNGVEYRTTRIWNEALQK